MNLVKRAAELREAIERMQLDQPYIIVEGKKDMRALNSLGLNRVSCVQGPLFSFIEKVASQTDAVVLLTDLDTEGRKLYAELSRGLTRLGVHVDGSFREMLFRSPVVHIEGLDTFVNSR